jgi:hypothetical protein
LSRRDLRRGQAMAEADWRGELDGWLEPFLAALGHRKRRVWAPVYVRGLLGPGERKSLQPMATGLGLRGHDQLQHFVASPAWDDAPLRRLLVERADTLVGRPDAVLVIDDTALPKQGKHSVGVARQYCGCLGKRANCQALVSLTLARGEVPVPVGLRLFLPEAWAADPDEARRARRLRRVGPRGGDPEDGRREPPRRRRARRAQARLRAAGGLAALPPLRPEAHRAVYRRQARHPPLRLHPRAERLRRYPSGRGRLVSAA